MEKRSLGNSGLHVSRIGLGCVTFGREIDEQTSFAIMDYAIAHGITIFDTAESYGNGESERIIGRWLDARGCRDQIILQTKVKPPFTFKRIQQALSGSLSRLGIDYLDIYLLHEFDQSILIEEALYAMSLAVHSRGVRAIGCSNFTVRQLNASENISKRYGLVRFEVVQPVYNILSREIESRLLPYCQKNKIGVMSYSPLAAGFVTGKYTQDLGTLPQGSRFSLVPGHRDLYWSPRNFAILQKLKRLADDNGTTMSRLALGWVLRNTGLDSILIGATSVSHVSNAIEALLTGLDSGLVEEMDRWGILPNSAE
jgi:aryl-alcohol dehydrogenase-like predicted oxidoreductase